MPPFIDVHWHQGEPFNWYAINSGRKLAGCTIVAIGQVMSYYQYPTNIKLTYENAEVQSTELNWDKMKSDNSSTHTFDCIICKQKARLMRQIGTICQANYNPQSTGAWPKVEYLNKLEYTGNEYSGYNHDLVMESLNKKYPCIISGFDENNEGHTWDIDGYKDITYSTITYEKESNKDPVVINRDYKQSTYLHFNMGWGVGSNNYILSRIKEYGSGNLIVGGGIRTLPG